MLAGARPPHHLQQGLSLPLTPPKGGTNNLWLLPPPLPQKSYPHAGYPPFFSDDPLTTCRKIVNWRLFLKFPDEIKISPAAHDLISRLMCDVDERLGTNGVQVCWELGGFRWVVCVWVTLLPSRRAGHKRDAGVGQSCAQHAQVHPAQAHSNPSKHVPLRQHASFRHNTRRTSRRTPSSRASTGTPCTARPRPTCRVSTTSWTHKTLSALMRT